MLYYACNEREKMTDKFYETMTVPFNSGLGDLTLTYATGRDATFDDTTLDTHAQGVKVGYSVKGIAPIMAHLVDIAPMAPAAEKLIKLMTSRWPGLRNYLPDCLRSI